jgi:hypothetical protein
MVRIMATRDDLTASLTPKLDCFTKVQAASGCDQAVHGASLLNTPEALPPPAAEAALKTGHGR